MNTIRRFDAKWKANRDKVSFVRAFPGRLLDEQQAVGRTVSSVVRVVDSPGLSVTVFTDFSFIIGCGIGDPSPTDVIRALRAIRPIVGDDLAEAFAHLDDLTSADIELTRLARLENILGAIRTNIGRIPELHTEIPRLLARLAEPPRDGSVGHENPSEEQ